MLKGTVLLSSPRETRITLLAGLMAMVVGAATLLLGPVWVVAIFCSAALIALSFLSYPWMVAVVLVVRTYLDAYTEEYIYIGAVRVSAAAIFTLAMILLIVMAFLASRSSIPWSEGIRCLTVLMVGSLAAVFTGYARLGSSGNVGLR